jgi:hypothetical protein
MLPALTVALEIVSTKTFEMSSEIEKLKKYAEITELTREVVTSLIKSIHVSEPVRNDKEVSYNIEILYRFQLPQMGAKKNTASADAVSIELQQ